MKWKFFFMTWFYSVVFNTILLTFFIVWPLPSYLTFKEGAQEVLWQGGFIGLFSLPFSMPGLLVLILACNLTQFFMDAQKRFLTIVIFSLSGVFAGYLLLWAVIGISPFREVLAGVGISCGSVLAALLINKRFFYKVFMPGYKRVSRPVELAPNKASV